ncbi:hypothetical protein NDU88_002660 [Pleurodeles waltl]|uniref:Uncharacterized protein n=1 Tax=Pleurodeles waltl TaxID=8319 RepID=A0AAV7QDB9_PLEWA|nr:hypothetical protein NDU88_002660 [Pleurodeles waltl]
MQESAEDVAGGAGEGTASISQPDLGAAAKGGASGVQGEEWKGAEGLAFSVSMREGRSFKVVGRAKRAAGRKRGAVQEVVKVTMWKEEWEGEQSRERKEKRRSEITSECKTRKHGKRAETKSDQKIAKIE